MNSDILSRYNGLLSQIAISLGLTKASEETMKGFSSRILYSAIGHLAMASLFDPSKPTRNDDMARTVPKRTVSVVHFKRRIKQLYHSYLVMYPEIRPVFFDQIIDEKDGGELLAKEMLLSSYRAGAVYHYPHRLASPTAIGSKPEEQDSDVVLIRGGAQFKSVFRSGLGPYVRGNPPGKRRRRKLSSMFALGRVPLVDYWEQLIHDYSLKPSSDISGGDYTYLNLENKGRYRDWYYTGKIDKSGKISLMRRRKSDGYDYYLYRYRDERIEKSKQLDECYVMNGEHRRAANGCLAARGALPAIKYFPSSELVWLEIDYLPPPAEKNLIQYYSWPQVFEVEEKYGTSSPYHRVMAKPVFEVILKALEPIGFVFTPLSERPAKDNH
ncbi:MAG: hypothetical protein IJH68_02365 [Thermoguttaceae bacterium]|nr:hypothetical protein [Thermoguttaceae bacterium]